MALEVREVKVWDEQHRLGLKVGHRLEDGHVVPLLEEGDFYVGNCKKTRKDKRKLYIWTLNKHVLFQNKLLFTGISSVFTFIVLCFVKFVDVFNANV